MITYKGYTALLEVDVPSGTIIGHVLGIRDELVFQGKTAEEAVSGFHQTVDFYLSRLALAGQEPERPFSGRFNVRIDSETHRALVLDAESRRISLNEVVKRAFAAYLASTVGVEGPEAAVEDHPDRARPAPGRSRPAQVSAAGPPGPGTRRRTAGTATEGIGGSGSGKPRK